jgi:very-short-patch-repair endonuclease
MHEIFVSLDKIYIGRWCKFCMGNSIETLCDNSDCKWCFDRSFASHEKSSFWSKKNNISPRQVRLNSNKKYIFNCFECKHEISLVLRDVVRGQWCGYCDKYLCDISDCKWCFERSFASHEKSSCWNEKNNISPRQVRLNSHKEYIFNCPDCNNEYTARLYSVNAGVWCTCIKNKTEAKLFEWLKNYKKYINMNGKLYKIKKIKIKKQKKFSWCKKEKKLPFDFYLKFKVTCQEEKENCIFAIKTLYIKIIIELDGKQHFVYIKHWKTNLEDIQETDNYKENKALEKEINVIRIYQPSVWEDKEDWEENLKNAILSCIQEKSRGKKITIGEIYKEK